RTLRSGARHRRLPAHARAESARGPLAGLRLRAGFRNPMRGGPLEYAHFAGEAVQRRHRSRALAAFDRGSRADEAVDHPDQWPVQLRREKGEELLSHAQPESGLPTRALGRRGLSARDLASLAKPDGDLDDEDRLDQESNEREQIVTEDPNTRRRQKQDVGAERRDHRREETRPASAVPRGDDDRRRKTDEGVLRSEVAEEGLHGQSGRDHRDRHALADEHAHITIHPAGAAYRRLSLESARWGLGCGWSCSSVPRACPLA